jgi:hypothetical protein
MTHNVGLAKAGQTEVIEHLYFYQHLCYIWADGFQSPAFANTQTVGCHTSNQIAKLKLRTKIRQ